MPEYDVQDLADRQERTVDGALGDGLDTGHAIPPVQDDHHDPLPAEPAQVAEQDRAQVGGAADRL